eukprot:TRINITY_DN3980_c0_g1_i1.p1 TRINITY_DN3980_c0_g1~~TRINITY_DN3980_c0_g1_i1.p1  ORF type:complete len:204 (+),score=65.76 TRINITY_DN3980_c0_g1_i1:623-1234(+)
MMRAATARGVTALAFDPLPAELLHDAADLLAALSVYLEVHRDERDSFYGYFTATVSSAYDSLLPRSLHRLARHFELDTDATTDSSAPQRPRQQQWRRQPAAEPVPAAAAQLPQELELRQGVVYDRRLPAAAARDTVGYGDGYGAGARRKSRERRQASQTNGNRPLFEVCPSARATLVTEDMLFGPPHASGNTSTAGQPGVGAL